MTIQSDHPAVTNLFAKTDVNIADAQAEGLSVMNSWGALVEFALANFMLEAMYQGTPSKVQDELVQIAWHNAHPLAAKIHAERTLKAS